MGNLPDVSIVYISPSWVRNEYGQIRGMRLQCHLNRVFEFCVRWSVGSYDTSIEWWEWCFRRPHGGQVYMYTLQTEDGKIHRKVRFRTMSTFAREVNE